MSKKKAPSKSPRQVEHHGDRQARRQSEVDRPDAIDALANCLIEIEFAMDVALSPTRPRVVREYAIKKFDQAAGECGGAIYQASREPPSKTAGIIDEKWLHGVQADVEHAREIAHWIVNHDLTHPEVAARVDEWRRLSQRIQRHKAELKALWPVVMANKVTTKAENNDEAVAPPQNQEWSEPKAPKQWERKFNLSWKQIKRLIFDGKVHAKFISSRRVQILLADLPATSNTS